MRRGLRYLTLLTVLLGATLGIPGAAGAQAACDVIEHVYEVPTPGTLVSHDVCGGPVMRFRSARTIAVLGPDHLRLLWGGQRDNGWSVFYSVTSAGQLFWYAQVGDGGELGAGMPVGTEFGDWNKYPTLLSTGDGYLYGVDGNGHLLQWMHYGWHEGVDAFDPAILDLGPICLGTRPVYANPESPLRYVGMHSAAPGFMLCPAEQAASWMSVLPSTVDPGSVTSAVRSGVTYARQADDGRLVRLALGYGPGNVWQVTAVGPSVQPTLLGGRTTFLAVPHEKYEWQFGFYGATS